MAMQHQKYSPVYHSVAAEVHWQNIFNDVSRKKTEPVITLYKIVLENDIITPDTFNKNVLSLV